MVYRRQTRVVGIVLAGRHLPALRGWIGVLTILHKTRIRGLYLKGVVPVSIPINHLISRTTHCHCFRILLYLIPALTGPARLTQARRVQTLSLHLLPPVPYRP